MVQYNNHKLVFLTLTLAFFTLNLLYTWIKKSTISIAKAKVTNNLQLSGYRRARIILFDDEELSNKTCINEPRYRLLKVGCGNKNKQLTWHNGLTI